MDPSRAKHLSLTTDEKLRLDVIERAIEASHAGDVPDLAIGVFHNLNLGGWTLTQSKPRTGWD